MKMAKEIMDEYKDTIISLQSEPVWITVQTAIAVHAVQLSEHGGSSGLRDRGLLESAMARAEQIHHDEPDAIFEHLAAAYVSAIIRNHPFVDGNKRTGFVLGALFLSRNGRQWKPPQAEAANVILEVAAGTFTEEMLTGWMLKWSAPASV